MDKSIGGIKGMGQSDLMDKSEDIHRGIYDSPPQIENTTPEGPKPSPGFPQTAQNPNRGAP